LLAPQESFVNSDVVTGVSLPDPVQTTFLGRVFLGTIAALGLFLAFRELGAAFKPHGIDVLTLCLLRFLAVAAGGLFTGAGRTNGAQPGFAVGLFVGLLLTVNDVVLSGGLENWWPIGLAVGFPLIAGTTGWIGSRVWPAPVELPNVASPAGVTASRASTLTRLSEDDNRKKGERPTVWVRVLIGGLVAFAAVVASEQMRTFLTKASVGFFQTGGASRAAAVGAQIAAMVLVIGGMIAGANTGAGLRHGFYASLLTTLNLAVAAFARGTPDYPPIRGLFLYLDLPFESMFHPQSASVIAAVLIALVTAGGWLGGQLFPILAPEWMRNRKLSQQS
jgi:hypothetical protein